MKLNDLYEAILQLESVEECQKFFRDLCTEQELTAFNERFAVAMRLYNKESYRKIAKETGASTTTVTRVARWLKSGSGGYSLILDRISKEIQ